MGGWSAPPGANTGATLGVDLYQLWRAGRDSLPSVAAAYATASEHLANTGAGLSAAFQQPDQFGGSHGPVYAVWVGLRDELQGVLAATATNLELVGEALCLAATEYARVDSVAAAEFDQMRRVEGDVAQVDVPVPRYPQPPGRGSGR